MKEIGVEFKTNFLVIQLLKNPQSLTGEILGWRDSPYHKTIFRSLWYLGMGK
jgi:hypothetical protein